MCFKFNYNFCFKELNLLGKIIKRYKMILNVFVYLLLKIEENKSFMIYLEINYVNYKYV